VRNADKNKIRNIEQGIRIKKGKNQDKEAFLPHFLFLVSYSLFSFELEFRPALFTEF
jgi:hypothetical protein